MYTKWNIISRLITREPKEAIIITINFLITIPAQHLHLYSKMPKSGDTKRKMSQKKEYLRMRGSPFSFISLSQKSSSAFPTPYYRQTTTTLNLNYTADSMTVPSDRSGYLPFLSCLLLICSTNIYWAPFVCQPLKPNRSLWGSWAQKPFWAPAFLDYIK